MNKEELDAIMKEKHKHDVDVWQQHLDAFIAYKCKQEAIGFLYWVDGEGYECTLHTDDNIKLWEEYPDVQLTPNRRERPKPKTTDELYTLYQQSKQK